MIELNPKEYGSVSLILGYSRWARKVAWFLLASYLVLIIIPSYTLFERIRDNAEEKEWLAIIGLVTFSCAVIIGIWKYFPKFKNRLLVTDEFIKFGSVQIDWDEVKFVWHSVFLGHIWIRAKDKSIILFPGLYGYDVVAQIAKNKKKSQQVAGGDRAR